MKHEITDENRMRELTRDRGWLFHEDGEFAEMSIDTGGYTEKTNPIPGVTFGRYTGDVEKLRGLVGAVEEGWFKYFSSDSEIFCGFVDGEPVSFCLIDENADDCILARPDLKVGSIGCVGTHPKHRKRGIGLRMVDLATLLLRERGCDKIYISYTQVDFWYARLGYGTFARFSIKK